MLLCPTVLGNPAHKGGKGREKDRGLASGGSPESQETICSRKGLWWTWETLDLRDHEDQLPHMLAGPYYVKVTQILLKPSIETSSHMLST